MFQITDPLIMPSIILIDFIISAIPAIFGLLADQISWTTAGLSLLPVLLLGFILGRRVRVR